MSTPSPVPPADAKRIRLRRAATCAGCGGSIAAGSRGAWHAASRSTWCLVCCDPPSAPPSPPPAAPPASTVGGAAGGSAQREYERRAAAREHRIREGHPRLGRILLALSPEPAHQRAWATGSAGERAVAARLDGLDDVVVLHDRRLRRPDGRVSPANIDHLVVAASGVWVVDSKQYAGSLEVRRSGGLLSERVEQLWIGGRDRSSLLRGVQAQADAVRRQLDSVGAHGVDVHAVLCFVGTDLPWFGSSRAQGVAIVGRRGLGKLVRRDGPLGRDEREQLAAWLAERFPAA